jgi:PAS domain S-box-containing protein
MEGPDHMEPAGSPRRPVLAGRFPAPHSDDRPSHAVTYGLALAVALGLLVTVAWLDWRQSRRTDDTLHWVARSHDMQARLGRLLSQMEGIETGSRGFVLTGEAAFLEPFEAGRNAVAIELRELGELDLDSRQRAGVEALAPLISKRIALSTGIVELRRREGLEAARQQVATAEGKETMDSIRAVLAEMEGRELALLAQRSAAAESQARHARTLSVLGIALSGVLLLAIFALVLRENRLRRRSEVELDRFFTLSLDLLAIAGTDGHFKRLNPAFGATLGYSTPELLARPFLDLVHPGDRAATLLEMAKLERGTPSLEFENRYRCQDGSWRWISWRVQPFPDENLLYATARDVTANKQMEESLLAANRQLNAANTELESFSYSVSHDLRAPLRSIDGFCQVLLEDYAAVLDAEGRSHLDRVRAAAQRMGELIDDLLGLARVSRAELLREQVSLSALAQELGQEIQARHPERAVTLTVQPGMEAAVDPRLLRIALENLIGNAFKFTRDASPASVEVGATRTGGEVVYFVRDNGAGFDMSHAGKLFSPFQRLHSPAQFEGSGIGLAIVARIVRRHGGEIRAESAVGQGATFYFTLGPDSLGQDRKGESA